MDSNALPAAEQRADAPDRMPYEPDVQERIYSAVADNYEVHLSRVGQYLSCELRETFIANSSMRIRADHLRVVAEMLLRAYGCALADFRANGGFMS